MFADGIRVPDVRPQSLANCIYFLLKQGTTISSPIVTSTFARLKALTPYPRYQLVPPDYWGMAFMQTILHANPTFSDAVSNILEATGR
jgi:hypothetical protein